MQTLHVFEILNQISFFCRLGDAVGRLYYGHERREFRFPDRVLAHLQALISAKLRRDEPFFLNWSLTRAQGSGRQSLWIAPSVPIGFRYTNSKRHALDSDLLARMSIGSSSANGLDLGAVLDTLERGDQRPVI